MKNRTAALALLLDAIIPGDDAWPAATQAIDDAQSCLDPLSVAERRAIVGLALSLPDDGAARVEAIRRFEREQPALFNLFVAATMRAYYQSPPVHARVRMLAESGPREASAWFDESLLEKARARGAGQRKHERSVS